MPSYTPLRGKIRHTLNVAGSPYTWQPPQGVTNVDIILVGGGGGGGGSFSGGGAATLQGNFVTVKGTTYTLTVGVGGTGGVAPTNGGVTKINDGSNDIFVANGGSGNSATVQNATTDLTIRATINLIKMNDGPGGVTGNVKGTDTEFAAGGAVGGGTGSGGSASFNNGGAGDPAASANNGGGGGWDVGVAATDTANDHGDGGDGRIILVYRLGSGVTDNVPT